MEDFTSTPVFRPKSSWTPPLGHPNLEIILSEFEKELFEGSNFSHFHWQIFSQGEWRALGDLAEDRGFSRSLSKKKYISEKELKYFTYNSKNVTNLEKFFT